jgi:hypothetical protein
MIIRCAPTIVLYLRKGKDDGVSGEASSAGLGRRVRLSHQRRRRLDKCQKALERTRNPRRIRSLVRYLHYRVVSIVDPDAHERTDSLVMVSMSGLQDPASVQSRGLLTWSGTQVAAEGEEAAHLARFTSLIVRRESLPDCRDTNAWVRSPPGVQPLRTGC